MTEGPSVLPGRIAGSAGLLLRLWTPEDAEPLGDAIAESLDHLRPWMPWIANEPETIERRRERIEEWTRDRAAGGDAVLGVLVAHRIAGGCGLHRRIAPDGLEIGYWIHPRFTRRGLATTVARLLTDAALCHPGISHVEIHHDKANVASAGIPRKLGFQFLGETRDEPEAPGELGIECRWRMDTGTWRTREQCTVPID